MRVKNNQNLNDDDLKALGASGVIRPSVDTIQIVLGTRAEKVAEEIRARL